MSFNDFAVQLYLTILAIAAAPILLSWVLRRIAGNAHHPAPTTAQESSAELEWRNEVHRQEEEEEDDDVDWWRYWSGRSDYT